MPRSTYLRERHGLPPRCDCLSRRPIAGSSIPPSTRVSAARCDFLQAGLGCTVDGGFGGGTECAGACCGTGIGLAGDRPRRQDFYRGLVQNNPKLAVFMSAGTS